MRFEPELDRRALLRDIRNVYGIRAHALKFVPASSYAACYEIMSDSERYFLKVWPRAERDLPLGKGQLTSLEVMRALHLRDLGVTVPRPLTTASGALVGELDSMPSVLTTWLEGKRQAGKRTNAFARDLGRTVGAIHLATAAIAGITLPREKFEVAFATSLRQDLTAAARAGSNPRPGLRQLSILARGRQEEVETQLERLQELRAAALGVTRPFVLCHTDLHDNNLLVDDGGRIGVVDWEDAKLAPPEHDVWAGLGDDHRGETFPSFMAGYLSMTGRRLEEAISWEHLSFYLLRRYLDDTEFGLHGMLAPDADEREDSVRLRGLEECAERWSRLDEMLKGVQVAVTGQVPH